MVNPTYSGCCFSYLIDQQALSRLYPTCIPCPTRATCQSPHSEPLCPPDYSLRPHVLSFGGLLPLSPSCGLDRLDEYQSLRVADAAEKIVHIKAGIQACKMYSRPSMSAALLARQRLSLEELQSEIESMKHVSLRRGSHCFRNHEALARILTISSFA